mgnify:CR=1 FL=1
MTQSKKIMIVDDDNFLLDMYALKFSESGYEVIPSSGSEDALSKLREGLSPDIMLLDIVMPKMDGFELMKVINKEKLASGSVKIVLSNRGQPADIETGNTLGASGYVVKASATPSEVVKKVKDIYSAVKK